jgi:hypothetical protein
VGYNSDMGADFKPVELNQTDNTLDAYRKWFDMNHMDFNIECRDNKWICSAWFRGKWGGAEGFAYGSIMEAVHSCYVEAKKETVSTSIRKRDWSPS